MTRWPTAGWHLKAAALTVALVTGSGAVDAQDRRLVHAQVGVDYAIPPNSPLRFSSIGRYGVGLFRGRFVMSGTWHYGYVSNDPQAESEYGVLELYFVPDADVARRLPYWSQRRPPSELRFTNEADFVAAVVPSRTIEALRHKRVFSASGVAEVEVSGYRISIECDSPTYSVTFIGLERRERLAGSQAFVDQFGC